MSPPSAMQMPVEKHLCVFVVFFDADATERIDRLARAVEGQPSEPAARRHVTLASFERREGLDLAGIVQAAARRVDAFDLGFPAVGAFHGGEGVVFLAPALTPGLTELHGSVHAALNAQGVEADPYTRPGAWVPHCTVATGVAADRIGEEVARVQRSLPIRSVRAVELAAVQLPPIEVVARAPLGDAAS